MAPKKKKGKKDDDWEDEADQIAQEADPEVKPETKAAPADDDDDDFGGKKKKVRTLWRIMNADDTGAAWLLESDPCSRRSCGCAG
jgi:hypothetical protein